jgi:hypothetical protein
MFSISSDRSDKVSLAPLFIPKSPMHVAHFFLTIKIQLNPCAIIILISPFFFFLANNVVLSRMCYFLNERRTHAQTLVCARNTNAMVFIKSTGRNVPFIIEKQLSTTLFKGKYDDKRLFAMSIR